MTTLDDTSPDDPQHAELVTEPGVPSAPLVEDPGALDPKPVERAVAVLSPTKQHDARGTVTFRSDTGGQGLTVEARFSGLPKGLHAFHVHLFGDCSGDDAESAGTHFNFAGRSQQPPQGIDRITGNLGVLEAGADGSASFRTQVRRASLDGRYSIIGRSVVVHERGNDPDQPPLGGAGGRLACGAIGIAAGDAPEMAAKRGATTE